MSRKEKSCKLRAKLVDVSERKAGRGCASQLVKMFNVNGGKFNGLQIDAGALCQKIVWRGNAFHKPMTEVELIYGMFPVVWSVLWCALTLSGVYQHHSLVQSFRVFPFHHVKWTPQREAESGMEGLVQIGKTKAQVSFAVQVFCFRLAGFPILLMLIPTIFPFPMLIPLAFGGNFSRNNKNKYQAHDTRPVFYTRFLFPRFPRESRANDYTAHSDSRPRVYAH